MRFKVLTAANMKMTAFSVAASRNTAEIDRRFKDAYCLHHQGNKPEDSSIQELGCFLLIDACELQQQN
jgi:hypothetical protein